MVVEEILAQSRDLSQIQIVNLVIDQDVPMIVATVRGTREDIYGVRWEDNSWHCTCQYFFYTKDVKKDKHINRVRLEVFLKTGVDL